MISDETREELRQQLLSDRQRLEDEISTLSTAGVRGDAFLTDDMQDAVDQHPADEGSELFEREKNLTLQRALEEELQAVNTALHKMELGTYGICDACGKEIPEKRLRAMPTAVYCVEDQARIDKQNAARVGR